MCVHLYSWKTHCCDFDETISVGWNNLVCKMLLIMKGLVLTMYRCVGKEFLLVFLLVLNICSGANHRGPSHELNLNEDQVWKWTDTLSRRLNQLSANVTGIDSITAQYTKFSYLDEVKGDDLIDDLASKIEKLLKDRVTALDNLVDAAEKLYEDYTIDEHLDIDYLNSKKLLSEADLPSVSKNVVDMEMTFRSLKLLPDQTFNSLPVTKNTSTIQVPTNVFDRSSKIMNGAHWTKPLDDTFINNFNNYSLTWQYYCSTDGFFRIFPGMKWPNDNIGNNIDLFDCRVRSWYLQAATCPKNVIILIDTSGSMKGLRMEIARSTVKQIIDTLDDDDYFNIIRFSDTFSYLDECFNGTMMAANSINKQHMAALVDDTVDAKNKANFEIAFIEAFRLLDAEYLRRKTMAQQGYLCNKAILLITDGVPEHHAPLFDQHNWPNKTTRIFTYLIGREIGDEREVKWMACANKGYYTHISTLADVRENVQNYIRVLSRPMVINRFHNKIWTSVYLDHMSSLDMDKGLEFLTSVAIPVFDKKNETEQFGNLLGVVGTDIPIKQLQEQTPAYKLGANGYAFMINHNGYVLFHPDYRPYFTDPETKDVIIYPHYQNVDLSDVLLPTNQAAFNEVRKHILTGHIGSKMLEVLTHYDNMKRMVWRNYSFSYKKVMDTNFSLGIALPTTSFVKVMMVPVMSDKIIYECLNESSTLLAPWKYCKTLDENLTALKRTQEFKRILKNDTLQKLCDEELKQMVVIDSKCINDVIKEWSSIDSKAKTRDGVEIVFVGTPSGVTKYMLLNPESNALNYLLNRTSTVEADYYRRAIEGAELLDNQPHWNYTFSTPIGDEYDDNGTMVTVSAPVVLTRDKKMGVAAVVGYQMKHSNFQDMFIESVEYCRMLLKSCQNTPCKEKHVNCYLIDNHGYIVAGPYPSIAGIFFGEIEGSVMTDMIQTKHLFVGYNFTDYQSLCEIKADAVKDSSSGASVLNPLKLVFNLFMWIIAEIALFISEFSVTTIWTPSAVGLADCENISDYEDMDMSAKERMSYQQAQISCFRQKEGNKVVGHRPCVKRFTLYHSDLKVFHHRKPILHGTIDGCIMCAEYYSPCSQEEAELGSCVPNPQCVREASCLKSYVVSWVQGTNLLMVVTAADCECNTTMPFNMDHVEVEYSEDELCYKKTEETYKDRSFTCIDQSSKENVSQCGAVATNISCVLLMLTFFLSTRLLCASTL